VPKEKPKEEWGEEKEIRRTDRYNDGLRRRQTEDSKKAIDGREECKTHKDD